MLHLPISQCTCSSAVLRRLLQTTEEIDPPRELSKAEPFQLRTGDQFVHAILDPFYNAIHVALQRRRAVRAPELNEHLEDLANKLFEGGPTALTAEENRALLSDGPPLAKLHI